MSRTVREQYEEAINSARVRFALSPALYAFLDPMLETRVMELFLMRFCSLGVSMTEPVEGWIDRSGQRCEALGLSELGQALRRHARQEAGHHLLMLEDTHKLVARWNARRLPHLDAEQLLSHPPTPGIVRYRQLHEDTIAGATPYAQIAIEYEIELLSVRYGPALLERCGQDIGPDTLEGLSFLREHVALDVGHTKFNDQQLANLLENNPERLLPLVRAGAGALDAYAAFLADCLRLAKAQALEATRKHLNGHGDELPEKSLGGRTNG